MIYRKKDVTPDELHAYARWVGSTGRPVAARIMHWSAEIIAELERKLELLTRQQHEE